jgi:hypothetical protein
MESNIPKIIIEEPDFFEIIGKYYTTAIVWLLNKFSTKAYIVLGEPSIGSSLSYKAVQKKEEPNIYEEI